EFDSKGRLTKSIAMDKDGSHFEKSELDNKTASIYMYNEMDVDKKNKIKLKKRQIYPVYDHNILVKPNYKRPYDRGYGSDTLNYRYDYILDKKGRIVKEINYGRSTLPFTESEYIYDDHDKDRKSTRLNSSHVKIS